MIDTLIAFGCSNTYGAEAISDGDHKNPENINNSYPKFLSDLLGCRNYINLAANGISNSVISSKIITYLPEYIKKYGAENIFVIIGWTDNNRMRLHLTNIIPFKEAYREIFDVGEWPLICKFFPKTVKHPINYEHLEKCDSLIKKFPFIENFFLGLLKYIFRTPSFYYSNVCIKLATEYFLKQNNVKYFTFPSLVSHAIHNNNVLSLIDPERDKYFFDAEFLLDKKFNLYENDPDGTNNFNMLEKFGIYGKAKSGGHLNREGHKKLAEFLFKEIKDRSIL